MRAKKPQEGPCSRKSFIRKQTRLPVRPFATEALPAPTFRSWQTADQAACLTARLQKHVEARLPSILKHQGLSKAIDPILEGIVLETDMETGLAKVLGRGQHGVVFKGKLAACTSGERQVAIKMAGPFKAFEVLRDHMGDFVQEVATMLACVNKTTMVGALGWYLSHTVADDGSVSFFTNIVTDLAKGSLADVCTNGEKISAHTFCRWFSQLMQGICDAAEFGFHHNDIKPENLLVMPGRGQSLNSNINGMDLRLADMGLAKVLPEGVMEQSSGGSRLYCSVFGQQEELGSQQRDVLAAGMAMGRMLADPAMYLLRSGMSHANIQQLLMVCRAATLPSPERPTAERMVRMLSGLMLNMETVCVSMPPLDFASVESWAGFSIMGSFVLASYIEEQQKAELRNQLELLCGLLQHVAAAKEEQEKKEQEELHNRQALLRGLLQRAVAKEQQEKKEKQEKEELCTRQALLRGLLQRAAAKAAHGRPRAAGMTAGGAHHIVVRPVLLKHASI